VKYALAAVHVAACTAWALVPDAVPVWLGAGYGVAVAMLFLRECWMHEQLESTRDILATEVDARTLPRAAETMVDRLADARQAARDAGGRYSRLKKEMSKSISRAAQLQEERSETWLRWVERDSEACELERRLDEITTLVDAVEMPVRELLPTLPQALSHDFARPRLGNVQRTLNKIGSLASGAKIC